MSHKKPGKSGQYAFEKLNQLLKIDEAAGPYEAKFSIIIASQGNQERLTLTLSKIFGQSYKNFEVVLLDGGEFEQTLETINEFKAYPIYHYSVTAKNVVSMFNRGVKFAKGRYLVFLKPGEYFLFSHLLQNIANLAFHHKEPKLIFDGQWLSSSKEVNNGLSQLTTAGIFYSKPPLSLCSIFFRRDVFHDLGLFKSHLEVYFLQAWLSRVIQAGDKSFNYFIDCRYFCDIEYFTKRQKHRYIFQVWERWKVIIRYFGIKSFVSYLFSSSPKDTVDLKKKQPKRAVS